MNLISHLHRAFFKRREIKPIEKELKQKAVRFSTADLNKLNAAADKSLTDSQPLEWLDMALVRRMHADLCRGIWADAQWVWEQLEKVDSHIIIAIRNRQASLSEYKLVVEKLPDLSEEEAILAEAQAITMQDLMDSIVNLSEAINELSIASRRHVTVLLPIEREDGLYLVNIPRWQLCQESYGSTWLYNARANNVNKGVPLPDNCIIRECDIYLDLPATALALQRATATAQWDVFLQRYGTPPFFFEMPEGGSDDDKKAFVAAAAACTSNSSGALPHGTKVLSVAVPATNVELFARRLALANDEILMLYTGSTLTTATTAGSGTLAGGAHADTASRIAADEARDIADCLTRQLLRPLIEDYHPTQPVLIRLDMRHEEGQDVSKSIADIAALAAAGYTTPSDKIKEQTGYEVTARVAEPTAMPTAQMRCKRLKLALHANRSRMHYAPAREHYERTINKRIATIEQQIADNMPLSPSELQALKGAYPTTWSDERVEKDANTAEKAFREALSLPDAQTLTNL